MTILTVRISEKEKAALKKHGKISKVVKEAIALYLSSEQSKEAFKKLRELQRAEIVHISTSKEVGFIKEDRRR